MGGGILMETAFGPLFAIVSGGTSGDLEFYFTLGRFFLTPIGLSPFTQYSSASARDVLV